MPYPYYTTQPQPGVQPVQGAVVYGYPQQPPQGQLEQLRAAQAYQVPPMAQTPPQGPQSPGTGIPWVQGEAGAKAYLVAPGGSVLLMDSEGQSFYIKSADGSGMPLPLRIFDYVERPQNAQSPLSGPQGAPEGRQDAGKDYITREEFEALTGRLAALEEARNAKPESKRLQPVEPTRKETKNG